MPGTELKAQRAEFSADSVENGPHGVLYLLCKDSGTGELDAALSEGNQEDGKKEIEVPYWALLEELESEKQKFDKLETSQFLNARAATNPYEKLGRHRFLNRSAMKLVTLDHVFKWTSRLGQGQQALSFADICGGPGGFSEYLLWRSGEGSGSLEAEEDVQRIRGFGITLKDAANNCDWRLPSELYDEFEICYGEDGTGNIYSVQNIHHFRGVVRARYPNGVDLVVADGGFLDARSQSNQEFMMTRLILAEVVATLAVLRSGGDFVCKTFELATQAMAELCWILHRSFDRFAVVKPITSRPASSERYIIARGLRSRDAIKKVVEALEGQIARTSDDTNGSFEHRLLSNRTQMLDDADFLQYMTAANEAIARVQVEACRRINEHAANKKKRKIRDVAVVDPKQYYQCWQIGKLNTDPRHVFE
ncbi:FtsJ-like RNA methyltransferase [Phytophthora cinnamomi]|uniref:FtsJ-like RNA methyltransferase n=1 Tax=Phytophthora cinnamomi TaxID=4785 RepID=UPI00355A11B3|nr:FtsJ-like RNA methyltransferase [Phytophthora cinnamomi]